MPRYTMSHWGTYEVGAEPSGAPKMLPYADDPDPSPIGLHMLSRRGGAAAGAPAGGPQELAGARPRARARDKRGQEPFVEVRLGRGARSRRRELKRVQRRAFGNRAIFGGSYGWSSAGRFHHAQSQVHRFLNAIGGYVRHVDSYSLGAARVLMPHIVAPHGRADVDAHVVGRAGRAHASCSSPSAACRARTRRSTPAARRQHRVQRRARTAWRQAGVRFVNVSPVRDDLDTGGAVEWIADPARTPTPR